MSTGPTIRSLRLSGQRPPPDSPSPLGRSVQACRGLVNGSADPPHFCYPVASPIPLSTKYTRMTDVGHHTACPAFGSPNWPAMMSSGAQSTSGTFSPTNPDATARPCDHLVNVLA